MKSLWPRRREWSICYRHADLSRGNHTNNLRRSRHQDCKGSGLQKNKAYNLTQMFAFITESIKLYYQRKLPNVSNSRMDHFVATKFLGQSAETVQHSTIESLGDSIFRIKSRKRLTGFDDDSYVVDMHIGTCNCKRGQNGSPCAHQAAVVSKYKTDHSVNCCPSLNASARHQIANLAIGKKAKSDINFYASLHQETYDNADTDSNLSDSHDLTTLRAKFLLHTDNQDTNLKCNDLNEDLDVQSTTNSLASASQELKSKLRAITTDMIEKLDSEDQQFRDGVQKFVKRYESLQGPRSIARLSSALHQFGWIFGGYSIRRHGVFIQRGKQIPVQATSAGRRKYGSKEQKKPQQDVP